MTSQPLPRQPLDRVEDRLVLGGGRDQVVAPPSRGLRDPLDGQVVRFGRPGGEDDLPGLGADGPGDLLAGALDRLGRLPAERCETLAALP